MQESTKLPIGLRLMEIDHRTKKGRVNIERKLVKI